MTTTEQSLINTLRTCPEAGFKMLMDQYQEPIYWHIRRLVVSHDDAQDATQETFVRIFRSMGSYRGDGSFRSWIYRIATNEALRCLSKRQEEAVSLESETTGVTLIADSHLEEADKLAAKLQRAILTLPPSSSWLSTSVTTTSSASARLHAWPIAHQQASDKATTWPRRKSLNT